LAHFGKRVCILERHSVIGGLNSFYRQGGRTYDVGLHALTNFTPKGTHNGPLARVLRQLRLAWEEWALAPQLGSAIVFPGATLQFSNSFELFEAEVRRVFPGEIDNLGRLVSELRDYNEFGEAAGRRSARQVLGEIIGNPLLIEMILCPILFYGSSREHDIDFDQFSILFRSIFLEGLARPLAGVQLILKMLVRRFKELGGELRLRSAVERIAVQGDVAQKIVLEGGAELETRNVLSSAGWSETMRLCDDSHPDQGPSIGRMSLVESISILDVQPRTLGHGKTIVFYNDSDTFHYEKPDGLVDLRSGVVCSPNNFAYSEPLTEGSMRISSLASYDRWAALSPEAYRLAKLRCYDQMAAAAVRFVPDFRGSVIETDLFTPLTIHRFTGHAAGAVYGSAYKRPDGTTHLKNLYICGND
jgi:phytoene dehydrogenase-like protein